MSLSAGLIVWLLLGSLVLAALAVVLDRVNFPQKPFRPRRIHTGEEGATRDRTGAHIVEEIESDKDGDRSP
ncbi:MAG: hypothetical protein AAF962_22910 [Actinomycetota bacterium]